MKTSYVYILKCSDGTYYTGVSSNLLKRIEEHHAGKHRDSYTYVRRPVALMFYAQFTDITIAISTEKQLKNWSKAKKEALISGNYQMLPTLSKKVFSKY